MNKAADFIRNILSQIFGDEKVTLYAEGKEPKQAQQIVQETAPREEVVQAKPDNKQATQKELEDQILAGLREYSRIYNQGKPVPAEQYTGQMAEAAMKYDIFKNNPGLLPQLMILETSGGMNVTRPNNLINWGINYPGNNEEFAKMSKEEVLARAISGLGERSPYYDQFRTGKPLTDEQLMEFAKVYEPANASYGSNLVKGIKAFQK